MRFPSPLRYPGGKSVLAGFLTDVIDLNELRGCDYYEPFAGGAGAALKLLREGVVSNIMLNDADLRVYAFWKVALNHPKRFAERILNVPLTIDEWRQQHEICSNPSRRASFDVGFATFFMNRCNRSGVLSGAGPIGGYAQTGKWRLGVRFNRENLAVRILNLSKLRKRINISCLDAVDFLKANLPYGRARRKVFVYLDPPYVVKGQRLYLNAYEDEGHEEIAKYLRAQSILPWIMSYDDNDLVRELYASCRMFTVPIRYVLQKKRTATEIIITPRHVAVPSTCRMGRYNEYKFQNIA